MRLDVLLDIIGMAFQWKVWKALTDILAGQKPAPTARSPNASGRSSPAGKLLGRACATNRAAGVIPCHRLNFGASGA